MRLLDAIRDIVLMVYPGGGIADANDAAVTAYGYSRDELLSLRITDLWATGSISIAAHQMNRASTEGILFETLHRRKDGSFFPVEVSSRGMELPSGGVTLNVVRDISERKEAEAERERFIAQIEGLARLAERRARELEAALKSMTDAVLVSDRSGTITMANKAALELIGLNALPATYSLLDYLGSLRLRFRDGRPIEREDLGFSQALRGETVLQREEIGAHPVTGAEIDLLISAAPIRNEAGEVVGAVEVARDVTDLMELDRMKEQFISVAAHELKTPVTVMKGFAQLLLRKNGSLTAEQRRMLERIDQGANRIHGIVQAILDASIYSSDHVELSLEPLDLAAFIANKVKSIAETNSKHRYSTHGVDHATVQADPVRLGQVLDTLLDNAARYSPEGGVIEVEVDVAGGWARVSVRDSGIGIPARNQGRIFQRFYRAHTGTTHDYGGLGVGLFIARQIVLLHGGWMHFESKEESGSTFWFSLPAGGEGGGR